MNRKYKFTGERTKLANYPDTTPITFYRIQAERDIPTHSVKKGDLGGWVEKEENLSHLGDCWIGPDGHVSGAARVEGDVYFNDLWHRFVKVFAS